MSEDELGQELQGEVRMPMLPPPQSTVAEIPGSVTKHIGSGGHAQNSIVYQTIQWSFWGGGLLSLAAIGVALYQGKADALAGVKDVWNIFAPLITLALGYLFGKGR